MSNKSSAKTLIIVDGDDAEEAELNPFSFREFIRSQSHIPDPDSEETNLSPYRKVDSTSSQKINLTFDPEVENCVLWEPPHSVLTAQGAESVLTAEDSRRCSATEEEEASSPSLWLQEEDDKEPISRRRGGRRGEDYERDDETTTAETIDSFSKKSQMQQLREENMCLRRTIKHLQKSSSAYKDRIQQLSEELRRRRREEEKEAQALESMVHSVEQNLHLMTKRAVKAENSVSKLKQELQQLQGHMEVIQSQNGQLRAEQLETMTTMKNNAQMAAEYLSKTTDNARSSIKQLLGEADTLHMVSKLLQTIDKISIHNSDIN